jgi:hypothetical protein
MDSPGAPQFSAALNAVISIFQADLIMNWLCRWRIADNGVFGLPTRYVDRDTTFGPEIANSDFHVTTASVLRTYPVLMQILVGDIRSYVCPGSQARLIRWRLLTCDDEATASNAERDTALRTAEREAIGKTQRPAHSRQWRPNGRSCNGS